MMPEHISFSWCMCLCHQKIEKEKNKNIWKYKIEHKEIEDMIKGERKKKIYQGLKKSR